MNPDVSEMIDSLLREKAYSLPSLDRESKTLFPDVFGLLHSSTHSDIDARFNQPNARFCGEAVQIISAYEKAIADAERSGKYSAKGMAEERGKLSANSLAKIDKVYQQILSEIHKADNEAKAKIATVKVTPTTDAYLESSEKLLAFNRRKEVRDELRAMQAEDRYRFILDMGRAGRAGILEAVASYWLKELLAPAAILQRAAELAVVELHRDAWLTRNAAEMARLDMQSNWDAARIAIGLGSQVELDQSDRASARLMKQEAA